jgi:hypothetical protein
MLNLLGDFLIVSPPAKHKNRQAIGAHLFFKEARFVGSKWLIVAIGEGAVKPQETDFLDESNAHLHDVCHLTRKSPPLSLKHLVNNL